MKQVLEDSKKDVSEIAARAIEREMKKRIFVRGEATDGSKIGKYSTKPMYAGGEQLRQLPKGRFGPRGKNSRFSTFKNGKPRMTRYLPDGYSEFRDRSGRQNEDVDLDLTGASKRTIKTGEKGDTFVVGFTSKNRMEILLANQKKFGKTIFEPSEKEREIATHEALQELRFKLEFECL